MLKVALLTVLTLLAGITVVNASANEKAAHSVHTTTYQQVQLPQLGPGPAPAPRCPEQCM